MAKGTYYFFDSKTTNYRENVDYYPMQELKVDENKGKRAIRLSEQIREDERDFLKECEGPKRELADKLAKAKQLNFAERAKAESKAQEEYRHATEKIRMKRPNIWPLQEELSRIVGAGLGVPRPTTIYPKNYTGKIGTLEPYTFMSKAQLDAMVKAGKLTKVEEKVAR